MIDNRETHETTVSSCEGDKCKPRRCMLPDCIAPTVCHTGTKPFCVAREIYTFEDKSKWYRAPACMACGEYTCNHSYNMKEYGQETTPRGLTSI